MLGKEAIEEFQAIYLKEFGKRLSIEEATEHATNLLRLYKSVLLNTNNEKKSHEKKDQKNL